MKFEFSQKKLENNLSKKLHDMKYEFKANREGNIIYVGEVRDLYWDITLNKKQVDLRGQAQLTKYDLHPKKILHKILPSKYEILRPLYKEWSYQSGRYNSQYLISNGKSCTETNWSHHYRGGIYETAKTDCLLIKDEIFEYVFSPIDDQLMEIYKEVKTEINNW